MATSPTAGRRYNPRPASKVDISLNLFTDFVDSRQPSLFYDVVTYDTVIRNGRWFDGTGAPSAVRNVAARLDESLDDYAEDRVEQYGGLSRMVNRNDDTVKAVLVGGRAVFVNGEATDLVGKQRTGRFLRAAHKAPAVTAQEGELASVS
jgi:N-acyl-D-aspartate/D-glutamate deacylase